ncbi:MAG: hypothetical protein ABIT96_06490 [Ferruginibacter sp.]
MKVEQLIVQYLYNNKHVSIQNMGSFAISPQISLLTDNDKDVSLPPNSIEFIYNPNESQDDGLIDFIIKQTRKIRPLATSDLESYSILSRQFLNIGKPLVIPGLGTLQKNQIGTYDFMQGTIMNARLNDPAPIKEDKHDQDPVFKLPAREKKSKTGIILILLLMVIMAAGAMYYLLRKTDSEQPVTTTIVPATDTLVNMPAPADTLPAVAPKPYAYAVVFRQYQGLPAAQKAYVRFIKFGHKLVLTTTDSVTFNLAMPFDRPLEDTVRLKDSLAKFFQGKTFIEQ